MIRVAVNGYGTIGKRVADAVSEQDDMVVVGVAKTKPNFEARHAVKNGYPLYAAIEDRAHRFSEAGIDIEGSVNEMLGDADVVVDATPSGVGEQNKELYKDFDVKQIYQGGESSDVAEKSFTAVGNYDECVGLGSVRVVSCNTTGLVRVLKPLDNEIGVEKTRVTLVRRGGDPTQHGRGPINDILPNPITLPSHHGPDVNTVLPGVDIVTAGMKVPATLMHMHMVNIELGDASRDEIVEVIEDESRIILIEERDAISSTAEVKEAMLDRGRPRGDVWENAVWNESITYSDGELYLFQAIHQESDVIPENIDAIRALMGSMEQDDSMSETDDALGIGQGF